MKRAVVVVGIVAMLNRQPAIAQCTHQELIPSTGSGARFGESVAIDGATLVVGEEGDPYVGRSGVAYVFDWIGGTWAETMQLRPAQPPSRDMFGSVVALDQGFLAVSEPWTDAVYVFEREASGWRETARLDPSHCGASWFGSSLALKNGVLVAGDYDAECVTVFERIAGSWQETVHFSVPYFRSLATDGDTILLGSDHFPPRVLTYERVGTDWVPGPPIVPSDALLFGQSVAVDGRVALIGDPGYADTTGQAHVFRKRGNAWVEEQVLRVAGSPTGDWLGWYVAVEDDRAVVTSAYFTLFRGRAHVFDREGGRWTQTAVLADSICAMPRTIAISRGRVAMGIGEDRVHVFGNIECGAMVPFCEPTPLHSGGLTARMMASGSLHISDGAFELEAYDCNSGATGFFFYAATPNQVPFETGYLCVGRGAETIFRFPPVQVPHAGQIARYEVDFTQPPAGSGPGQIVPGSTWYFQFAFHDAGTLALTEGMRVTFCP